MKIKSASRDRIESVAFTIKTNFLDSEFADDSIQAIARANREGWTYDTARGAQFGHTAGGNWTRIEGAVLSNRELAVAIWLARKWAQEPEMRWSSADAPEAEVKAIQDEIATAGES